MRLANRGSNSQIWMPGTAVEIWLEFASVFCRSVWFKVECVLMGGASLEENEDAGALSQALP